MTSLEIKQAQAKAALRKKWELDDWTRDINSYSFHKKLHERYGSEYASEAMKRIKARWPGKEHLFD